MFSIGKKTIQDKLFWSFIVLFSVLKLFVCRHFPLTHEELFFSNSSNFISSLYLEHPPVTTYFLKVFSLIFGNTNLMPRICWIVVYFITAYILYCFVKTVTKSLFVSQASILLLYATPVLNMLESSSDMPFLLFFVLSVYVFYYFIETKNNKYLYFLSLVITFGLLSKYTMFCIYPSILLFLLISKENRYVLKDIKFYVCLFLPVLIFFVMAVCSKIPVKSAVYSVSSDVLSDFRLRPDNNVTSTDVALQFIGSQVIFYNPVLIYIYKDILMDIIVKYVPFIKYYAFFTITVLSFLYIHMLYLYKKTKQNFPLFIFCFSIIILACSIVWSFKVFPVEYCAKVSFLMLYIYIAYLFSKKTILKLMLLCFIVFGLYISLINPIYVTFGYDSLHPDSIIKNLRENYDFKKSKEFAFLSRYLNNIDDNITKNSTFIIHMDCDYLEKYFYYLAKQKYDFRLIFLFDKDVYFWNQHIKDLNGKDCFIFLNSENDEWFPVHKKLMSDIAGGGFFDNVEQLSEESFFCKNFNYEKYKENFSKYHYELEH